MTKEETRKAAEIMLAYANGDKIQLRRRNDTKWENAFSPEKGHLAWAWDSWEYRIAPKTVSGWVERGKYCASAPAPTVLYPTKPLTPGDWVFVTETA